MINKIINPEVITYFICYNSDRTEITAHGVVEPNLQMTTGQPIMDTFIDRVAWAEILVENNIEIIY